ncbi:MAG: LLM class flavin-dependent oxidoreductase [Rhodoglobus sp.]
MNLERISIGVPGALAADVVRDLAARIEVLGFRGLWINDTPTGDSLAGLAAASESTSRLMLGTGVIPVDRRPAPEILRGIAGLDASRLVIGIGSGGPRDALSRVADAVAELKSSTSAPVLVGALGPRMRKLAAESADGILFNWLTPDAAVEAMNDLRRDASRAVRGVLYVRTIVDAAARPALEAEAAAYASYPSYAANFERIGATALETTLDYTNFVAKLGEYTDSVDEVVLRAITPTGSHADLIRFVETAASLFRR